VTWIEFGNESDHGNHHGKRYTPEEYADRYLAYRKAMKAVDPNIRLGAVLENVSNGKFGEWTKTVLARAGKEMDFAIHHAYLPGYSKNTDPPLIARKLFPASWAAPAQWTMDYRALRRLMRDLTGREDIPLAITEFNGSFVQQKPVPYRLCLGNALINAELVRVLMQPEFKITLANFWQFANEYWGSVKGYAPPYVKRPNYYVFQLYAQHFGDTLVRADVKCETYDSDGGWGMMPARGKPEEFKLLPGNLLPPQPWKINEVAGVKQREENGVLIAEITTDADLNYYHAQMQMDALPLTGYRLTGEIRTEGLERSRGAQLQIGDARGWTATHSCALTPQVRSGEWATVTADYVTLPDAKAVTIQPRRLEGTGSTGKLYFRNVNIVRFIPENLGAVPYLGVNASMSVDGRKCCLMVVNKSLDNAISATITGVRARAARARTLTGPAVDATNEKDPNTVALRDLPITMTDGSASASFPPCSVTAVELDL
jgi:alpha-L-arabinofuranosidase